MPRPRLCRRVRFNPGANFFKPRGIPMAFLQEVVLSVDEFEAIRLADLEGTYQDEGAKKMGVSRQTFGRILEGAHKKIAECLVHGKALRIEGGDYIMLARKFSCAQCEHLWEVPHGIARPSECPHCGSMNIHRSKGEQPLDEMSAPGAGRGGGRGGRRGPGRGQGRWGKGPG